MGEPRHVGRVCALILAGGRSRRMGTDKALLPLDGQTLLERAAAFWQSAPGVENVLVSVGEAAHLPSLPEGTIPVPDLFPGAGPLAGLHAGFAQTDAEVLYVSAVDMPFLRADALPPEPAGDAAVYAREGRPEPLFGAYRRTALPAIEAALRAGSHKMTDLLAALDTEYLPVPPALSPVVANLNTRAELFRALAGTPPLVLCTGWSGSGKTTFLEKLLPRLTARGLRVAVVKHDAHGFSMDTPGKDTWRLARAGAAGAAILGPNGWAVLSPETAALEDLRDKLPPADLVLGEGFKSAPYPKLEVHRRDNGKPFITRDATLIAAVTDEPLPTDAPQLGLEDAEACARLLCAIFFPDREAPGGAP